MPDGGPIFLTFQRKYVLIPFIRLMLVAIVNMTIHAADALTGEIGVTL